MPDIIQEIMGKSKARRLLNRPVLDKITFIHYKKGYGKPTGCNNDGKCQGWESATCEDCVGGGSDGGESQRYGFVSKGAKWKDTATYYINDNGGLEDLLVEGQIQAGAEAWDDFVDFELFSSDGGIHSINSCYGWERNRSYLVSQRVSHIP